MLEPHGTDAPLASFKECTFDNPSLPSGEAPTITVRGGGSVRLEECSFKAQGNSSAVVATLVDIDGTGAFYSDDATLEVVSGGAAGRRLLQSILGLEDVPAAVTFLSGDSDLVADAREVRG